MRRRLRATCAIFLFLAAAVRCTSLLGIDRDYRALPGDVEAGAAGHEDAGVIGVTGVPSATPEAGAAFPADPGPVIKVTAGRFHTCALFAGGVAKCWGRNDDYLELGNGSNASTAVPLPAMGTGLVDLFAGAHATCGKLGDGGVCAGQGDEGELGNGGDAGSAVPVLMTALPAGPVVIASGEAFMCSVLASGDVWCAGDGSRGELGDGVLHTSITAVRAQLGRPATTIAAFGRHACARLGDGTVECWGDDSFGQLGNGRATPDAGAALPAPVEGISAATAIGVGSRHSCAIVGSGNASEVWCWGDNGDGQLGDGTMTASAKPVRAQGLTGAASLAVGGMHACAGLLNAGIVKCWGSGGSGQLGSGRPSTSSTPTTVQSISYPESLTAGGFHTCALVASPNVVCWGSNDFGQLGNGDAPNAQAQPAQVTW